MKPMYTAYKCKKSECKKEIILITEEVDNTIKQGKYISCSHCGCKQLIQEKATDNLKECMDHGTWKKEHGAIKQVRQ